MAAISIGEQIISLIKSGLDAWKTYLEKKKELYELHLTKEKNKALDIAEQSFEMMDDFTQLTFLKCKTDLETHEMLEDLSREISKLKKKFDKLD